VDDYAGAADVFTSADALDYLFTVIKECPDAPTVFDQVQSADANTVPVYHCSTDVNSEWY
jgi:hypothetical protein